MSRKNNLGLASKLDLPAGFPSLSPESRIHVTCHLFPFMHVHAPDPKPGESCEGQSQLQSPETTARHPHARELPMTSHVHRCA